METGLIIIGIICAVSCLFCVVATVQNKKNVKETAAFVDVTMKEDLELIAVISAAIAASEGVAADSFVVRSIRRR